MDSLSFVGEIYILFFLYLQYLIWKCYWFMIAVEKEYYSFHSHLLYKSPIDDLDDFHLSKLIV